MDNQPSFDRGLLLPIGVGILRPDGYLRDSVRRADPAARATVEEVPTATAFKYELIGTEPGITTVTLEATVEQVTTPEFPTSELPDTSFGTPIETPIILPTSPTNSLITPSPVTTVNTATPTPITASVGATGCWNL